MAGEVGTFAHEIDFTSLTPPILDLPSKSIPFNATAVYIYNYTAYWLYFKDADVYIPPFWTNACRLLVHTTQYEYVEIKSPFESIQTPTATSYSLRLIWTNDPNAFYVAGSDVNVGAALAFNIQLLAPTTTSIQTKLKTVGTSVIYLSAKPDSAQPTTDWAYLNRQSIGFHNLGPGNLWVGSQAELGLVPTQGWKLEVNDRYLADISDQVEVWGIADAANTLVELIEIA